MYIQKIGAETVVARGVLYGCVLYVHTKIGAETVQRLDGLVALACMYIQK